MPNKVMSPGQDPVVTPDGYLFSREAILENLLQQKKAIKRKLDAWERSQQEEEEKVGEYCKFFVHCTTSSTVNVLSTERQDTPHLYLL
jgi:hypothetical protein